MNLWLIPFGLLMLFGVLILIGAWRSKPMPRYISAEQHQQQLAELRKGIFPCRFCGMDWFWEGNRHDPLRLAGVRTSRGAYRRLGRALTVGFVPVLYGIADLLVKINRKIRGWR